MKPEKILNLTINDVVYELHLQQVYDSGDKNYDWVAIYSVRDENKELINGLEYKVTRRLRRAGGGTIEGFLGLPNIRQGALVQADAIAEVGHLRDYHRFHEDECDWTGAGLYGR